MPQPDQDIYGELAAKKISMDEAKKALNPPETPDANAPKATPPQHVDKINPKAKFGDKKGEVRLPVDQWLKPTTSYKDGTDFVPETGPALLHKGEAVIPAEKNMANSDVMALVPGRTAKKPPKVRSHMTLESHEDGSHTITHHYTHPEHHKPKSHGLSNMDALIDHLQEHAGQPNSGEAEADAGNPESYQGGQPAASPAGAPTA